MKKTNVALFHSATRWVRYLPLLLCFIVFSSSDLAAQNFKSPEDAGNAVRGVLEQLIEDVNTSTTVRLDQQTAQEREDFFNYRYFNQFITSLGETGNTQEALAAVDKVYPVAKLGDDEEMAENAREELLDLITE